MIIQKADRIADIATYYFATKLQEVEAMNKSGGPQVVNLGIGSPDLLPPSSVIRKLQNVSTDTLANKYQSYRGTQELREAFADWYRRWFEVNLDPQTELLPLAGSKEGIMHISMSFLQQGDQVLVPNPGYPAYSACARIAGAKVVPYDLDSDNNWLPDLEKLEAGDLSKIKLMWINYPHMPTGARATLKFYEKLIPWAKSNSILICSDNPYAFILNDEIASPLQVNGSKEVCIELVSLSKCYNMAGWRVGALAGCKEYIDTVMTFKSNMDSGMYKPVQLAAAEALGHNQEWFDKLNATYRKRKKIALEIMNILEVECKGDSAGLFVWGKLPHQIFTSDQFINDILYGARVFLTPGHIFGSAGEGYIRISLCSTEEQLLEAYDRISNHLKLIA